GEACLLVFGHAIYESLALGVRPAVVAAFVAGWGAAGEPSVEADRALSQALGEPQRFLSPRELVRVDLGEMRQPHRAGCDDFLDG
ncbi:MAG: hypothetical protein ACRENE_20410, partial [Polyangiaceae bacterium]